MRIIHGYRFAQDEIDEYRETIYKNVVMGMKVSGCIIQNKVGFTCSECLTVITNFVSHGHTTLVWCDNRNSLIKLVKANHNPLDS